MTATGFPDASTAGIVAGTVLTNSGNVVANTAGAVIEKLNISGTITINKNNVTVRNCKLVSGASDVIFIAIGVTGTLVHNCDIDNQNSGGQGIAGTGTFKNNNIHNCADGIDVRGDNVWIEENYIHTMGGTSGSHLDGIQADGGFSNLTIKNNTVINEKDQTSAIMLDNYWGPIANTTITGNLVCGGDYAVYINEIATGQNPGGPVTGTVFSNNHLGTGTFGFLNQVMQLGGTVTSSGNVNDGGTIKGNLQTTGQPAAVLMISGDNTSMANPTIDSYTTDTGTVGDNITSDTTLSLVGTAPPNSVVQIMDGATQIGTATANASGAWTFTTPVLSDGTHNLTVQALSASTPLAVTIDSQAPNAPTISAQVTLSGNAEANSTVKIFDGAIQVASVTANASGAWSYSPTLSTGVHSFTAKAMDVAGNTGVASASVVITV